MSVLRVLNLSKFLRKFTTTYTKRACRVDHSVRNASGYFRLMFPDLSVRTSVIKVTIFLVPVCISRSRACSDLQSLIGPRQMMRCASISLYLWIPSPVSIPRDPGNVIALGMDICSVPAYHSSNHSNVIFGRWAASLIIISKTGCVLIHATS